MNKIARWPIVIIASLLTSAVSASEQLQMTLNQQGIELSKSACEYGRGSRVVDSLKDSLSKDYYNYLRQNARGDLAKILTATDQQITQINSAAAINFTQAATALNNNQLNLEFAEPYWQGNETCIQANLQLTANTATEHSKLNVNWQNSPSAVWQYSVASVDLAQINDLQSAKDAALQQALQNAVADNIKLIAQQGASKFALLAKHIDKIQLADIQNLMTDWQTLAESKQAQQFNLHVLVSLDSQKLEQQLNILLKKVTGTSIYITAEPFALKRQLITLLTEHNIQITSQPAHADLQLQAQASMLEQNNGYQNLIEIAVSHSKQKIIWQWQNDPQLITVSSQDTYKANQLIQAHMSLPQHKQTIIDQLEYLLIEQALVAE
ncbi:hypothetical protein DS2_18373 [Catenovulum agarivorans DS-2]|uniref:Uncharacterized protein n=1 Tax=Catenovulum agarivorans DS-2 TaxID=1328313 RepID=W7Q8A9_9ALTE|nr:hypothetical protein [Catenovulum agarivorans]EWH08236.1 hypothetical protein DS2_18373 [Catenovulum agarivorans DS-2]